MTVTFCGHGDMYYDEITTETLYDIIERLINKGAYEFLLGGYGNYAISKRNEWMVMRSDVIVAYVKCDWGGAAKTLSYAVQNQKQIINIYDFEL